jgi:spermidine synthase
MVVAELNPVVLSWCRGPLAVLTNNAAADPRVNVEVGDVAQLIRHYAKADTLEKLDAVILDLYTGPYVRSHKRDDPLFGSIAINTTRSALKPDGIFAVWGEDYDVGFAKRLAAAGFVSTHPIGAWWRQACDLSWKERRWSKPSHVRIIDHPV